MVNLARKKKLGGGAQKKKAVGPPREANTPRAPQEKKVTSLRWGVGERGAGPVGKKEVGEKKELQHHGGWWWGGEKKGTKGCASKKKKHCDGWDRAGSQGRKH